MKGHLAYAKYVLRHKLFVLRACLETGAGLWLGLIHDWSKLLPVEWNPYVRNFYTPEGRKRKQGETTNLEQEQFDAAWNHHQKCQPHHWQYWMLLRDDGSVEPLLMPEIYVREMVADWIGAGQAITGKRGGVLDWYAKNREKIKLHPETRALVEQLLHEANQRHVRGQIHCMMNLVRRNWENGVKG